MNPKSEGREKTRGRFFASNIIGTSPRIQGVVRLIEKIADSPLTVLITGESGTGKELIARTIHYSSSRFGKPFIDINCAALPESLLESELFGIERGVATGVERRVGKIEMASSGTLFLDEIGDMSLPAQTKLLRVLQERKMERVGGRSTINVDVRVLAATNKDLKNEIKKGSFREDLYYRLNVVLVHMPPLREMKEDILLLAQYFLSSFANELGRGSMHFSSGAILPLVNYSWPGNVRELENEVKRAAILADNDVIDESDLSENLRSVAEKNLLSGRSVLQYAPTEEENQSLKEAVEEYEIRLIKETLEKNRGNKKKTAKILGLTRQGLINKIKKYEERTLASKSIEIDNQPSKQENKGAHAWSEPVEPLRPKKAVQPFDKAQVSRQAERRHLTVMFCDLVGFTALSEQIDPEDLHDVIHSYLDVCTKVVRRFDGHIAKHFGDGLLIYFGYRLAHEDDAQRAVRTGLEIVGAIHELPLQNTRLQIPLQVRIGIHTGLVVIGGMGVENMLESVSIVGETPNIAAGLLSVAEPNTVVISSATHRLVEGLFDYHYLGLHTLKGFSTPLDVYRVIHESGIQSRFEIAITKGLTPMVGREREAELLLERWKEVEGGVGQVVLINGEPGIGKSRLVQALKEQLAERPYVKIESRCSPYYQNSALYPVINHLERLMQFKREDSPEEKLGKLEKALVGAGFKPAPTLQELVPLFASLLSLPFSKDYSPLNLTPQRQKQKILETLLSWLLKDAEKQPVLFIVEDLHWIDPSTLEFLNLVVDKSLTYHILILLTFRPDFHPLWTNRVHLTQITLNRLAQKQVEYMIERLVGGKSLPTEVLRRLIAKTDGIPLFVEELTKMVLESGLLREEDGQYKLTAPLPFLTIPASLQDSLMARLDRLATVKEVAQLGATLGREFTYELLLSVSSLDEATLKKGLNRLVEAEVLYQSGILPQAKYSFKHALIQEAAYQSLLKSKRQQYHKRIAKVVEEQFPDTTETQPELLAHHYTEAGLIEQAIPFWQKAGERARQRSANVETIGHLTKGLELLSTLPDTPERNQKELSLQTTLGPALIAIKGYAALEVEKAYARAHELCCQMEETPQIFPVLSGLRAFYVVRAEYGTARELGEQLLCLAQRQQDTAFLLEAHRNLGSALVWLGELVPAQAHLEQGIALYDRQQHRSHIFLYGQDPGVASLAYLSWTLLLLGYPDQALKTIHEALTLARELSHPYSLAYALHFVPGIHQFLREEQAAREWAGELIALSREQGFAYWLAWGKILRGWALAQQGKAEEGITQTRQGLTAYRATGAKLALSHFLALLSEAYGKAGQAEEGLAVTSEALAVIHNTGEHFYEPELYRLKGELLLALSQENQSEAERCFRQAIEIARHQSAKLLELRAVISLSRLRKKQGKKGEAQKMLSQIYGWFTEGFNTADLREAKVLLGELS